jgi:fumarylpyruvate hydrolase
MDFVFPLAVTSVPVIGRSERFPVRRIFCVGRNYLDHAREMGALDQADGREPPFFFYKPSDALVSGDGFLKIDYPPLTANLHHEIELVVALQSGGANLTVDAAWQAIFGQAVGLDLTRRDMQARAKEKGHPWDMAKGFDQSAVCGPIRSLGADGALRAGAIWLEVNGQRRQTGDVSMMSWNIGEVIANLSTFVSLAAGDLIFTGTPAGVGPVVRGDHLAGGVDGVGTLSVDIV